jgi:uncharacterized protein
VRFVDTNVILRFLTQDDLEKAQACFELLQRVQRGEENIVTSESVLAEIVYVLSSRSTYNLSHSDIAARLRPIVGLRGLKIANKRTCLRALDVYSSNDRLDFEDCLTVAHMERLGLAELISYDRDFDRIENVKRVEP